MFQFEGLIALFEGISPQKTPVATGLGCNCTSKSFDLVKIRAKSEEICAKYV